MIKRLPIWIPAIFLILALGCASDHPPRPIRLATTTSTANTGLLDYLTDAFKTETGIEVQYIAVGTGKALAHGENGDVDLVLVHAQQAEEAFIAAGHGVKRVPVMWNDFVIAGPAEDPAGIGPAAGGGKATFTAGHRKIDAVTEVTAADAFATIASHQAPFISRGDDSGTHKKELEIWKAAAVRPAGPWYIEAGQGMEECLVMAAEKRAYILTDRGTFLARKDLDLVVLQEGDVLLLNPYSLIEVSPTRYPDLNHAGARRLIDWLISPRGQELIASFKVDGRTLFNPVAHTPGSASPGE